MGRASTFLIRGYNYLKDDKIDMRIRMMYIVDMAVIVVCLIGGINLLLLGQSYMSVAPNLMMIVMASVSGGIAGTLHKYDLAAIILIIGCADVVVPIMYFLAGGSNSGMPLIFIFGVVLVCLMSKWIARIVLLVLTLIEDILCMFVGHFFSEWVVPLEGEDAGFYDLFQTFIYVGIGLSIVVVLYLSTYDRQRKLLEKQREELYKRVNNDELTGLYNRHAYYDESNTTVAAGYDDELTIVTMDVNGLKKINDTYGHAEGDKYIKKAADTIASAYSRYGKIFRTGGDEFVAILHCKKEEYKELLKNLQEEIDMANAKDGGELAIAIGTVIWREHKDLSFEELEKLADKRMYENKRDYYLTSGKDRRQS